MNSLRPAGDNEFGTRSCEDNVKASLSRTTKETITTDKGTESAPDEAMRKRNIRHDSEDEESFCTTEFSGFEEDVLKGRVPPNG